jgi:hypothetical protein
MKKKTLLSTPMKKKKKTKSALRLVVSWRKIPDGTMRKLKRARLGASHATDDDQDDGAAQDPEPEPEDSHVLIGAEFEDTENDDATSYTITEIITTAGVDERRVRACRVEDDTNGRGASSIEWPFDDVKDAIMRLYS